MKVICIDNICREHYYYELSLTINKCYFVLTTILNDQYLIKNDSGISCYYRCDRFITLKEYRKEKLEKLNERN